MNTFSTTDWGHPVGVIRNDFHRALLWLRSLEIEIGHPPTIAMAEINDHVFGTYRSPLKA